MAMAQATARLAAQYTLLQPAVVGAQKCETSLCWTSPRLFGTLRCGSTQPSTFACPGSNKQRSVQWDAHSELGSRQSGMRNVTATLNPDVGDEEDIELEKGFKMSRVCDRLIEVFMVDKPRPEDWRKLLAFSEEWSKIRPRFFKRCKTRAEEEEDPKKKGDLLKLARRLKEVDDDMLRHDELLADVEKNLFELDAVVARRRKDFTSEFFSHLKVLCEASYKDIERRDELVALAAKILSFVEAYDHAAQDADALNVAQMKLDDILNSPSLEAASNKIDELAKRQELDSTLMLMITKAWAAAKESTMMKDEVKDIMYHLYMVARGNMQRLVPKEVRIIRHILSIEDPKEQFAALTEAFSPGDELEGKEADTLYTKPDRLLKWIRIVLDAYNTQQQGTLIKEAQNLMSPSVIVKLEALKEVVEEEFL